MKGKTRALTESAMMIALSVVLSLVTVYRMPQGGSITAASMVPIIFIALRYNTAWGVLTALAYSGIQMLINFAPPPTHDFTSFVLVVLLDYAVAFGVLGLAGAIGKPFKNRYVGGLTATAVVIILRFLCHLLSGVLIWNVYAPEGQGVWAYSFIYNGSYMIPELIISIIVMAVLMAVLTPILDSKNKQ